MEDIPLGRQHARRLRDIYRSAGWPSQDILEIELLAAGMLERLWSPAGHETLRLTERGIALLAAQAGKNRGALSAHEALVEQVAAQMVEAGRIAWRGLSLRAQVPGPDADAQARWCVARPDVFSIRNTTVETYVEPVVHEIKVRRADLLGDLKQPDKRAAYCDMGECWYVLGSDSKSRCIADPSEVPPECGVIVSDAGRLVIARRAPPHRRQTLPFGVWMALAKATPVSRPDEGPQAALVPLD